MHSPEHDEWCAALAAEDAEAVPAELRREMQVCPECAKLIGELRAIQSELTRAGCDERDVLAAARALPPSETEQRIERRLRELAPANAAPERRPSAGRWRILATAAGIAIALGALAFQWSRTHPSRDQQMLGPAGSFGVMSPRGPTAKIERFTWEFELPPGGHFAVTVRAIGVGRMVDVVSSNLRAAEWTPSNEQLERLNRELVQGALEWRVLVDDGSGGSLPGSPWAPLSHSRQ